VASWKGFLNVRGKDFNQDNFSKGKISMKRTGGVFKNFGVLRE
jgi:hypothetical protein